MTLGFLSAPCAAVVMKTTMQASATVTRFCVCLVFNVVYFLYWLALPVSHPARNGCGTVYCFTDAYSAARVPAIYRT